MHADKPEFGWWEHKCNAPPMPDSLGHENNAVLSAVELAEYESVLRDMESLVGAEFRRVRFTSETLLKGRLPAFEQRIPTMFTVSHVLEFVLALGKTALRLTQLTLYVTRDRKGRGK